MLESLDRGIRGQDETRSVGGEGYRSKYMTNLENLDFFHNLFNVLVQVFQGNPFDINKLSIC